MINMRRSYVDCITRVKQCHVSVEGLRQTEAVGKAAALVNIRYVDTAEIYTADKRCLGYETTGYTPRTYYAEANDLLSLVA